MSSLAAFIVVLVAIALIVVLVFLAARYGLVDKLRRRFRPVRPSPPRDASELAPPASLGTAIAIALNELRMRASAAADPRTAPWALVIGSGGAELEALLPPERRAEHRVSWLDKPGKARAGSISFREQGVVIGFERGLVGEPDALAQLVDVLRELEAIRPDRPVDSLVVTVPLAEIMADMRDPAAVERVVARGRDLYELILAAQSRTGWRLPLYVLVTGGETVPGFPRLAAATVARNPSPAIGWAATSPIDRAFEPAWVDEAFDSMLGALSVEQLHLLMATEEGAEAEAALLLPERFAQARPAMRLLLSNMLHATAYHEAFMLRGVFLTGAADPAPAPLPIGAADAAAPSDGEAGAADEIAVEPVPATPQPLAAHLFLDKVFLERGLAQPAYGELTRRHRLVRRTQWAIAATALLFMVGLTGLQFEDRTQLPPVRLLLAQVAHVKKTSHSGGVRVVGRGSDERCVGTEQPAGWHREGERRTAISLLNQMAQIDVDQIESVFAPTSFLTNVTEKVKQAMEAGFRNVIFEAVIGQMTTESGIDELLRRGLPAEQSAEANWPLIVTNARRFVEHYQLLQEVAPAQRNRPGLTRDFGRIADYALQTRLPPGFLRNAELYSEAIARAPIDCLPDEEVARRLTAGLSTSYRQAVDGIYRDNLVAIAVDYIDRNFNGVVGPFDVAAAPAPADTDSWVRLGSLVAHLDAVSREIALPGRYPWLADPTQVTLPDVTGLRPLWDGTDLGPWLQQSGRPRAEQAAARLRSAVLTDAPIFVPGPAAAPAAQGAAPTPTVALSPSAEETVKYLRALFAKPFMRAWRSGPMATGPGLWNVPALQAAAATAKEVTALPLDPPAPVPPGIADEAIALARARSGTYLVRQVAAAIEPGLAAPAADTANFVEALPPLQTIRAALRQTAAADQAPAIDARINAQAWRVLRSADAELALDGGPYAVDTIALARWDGAGSLAAVAFAAGSPDELKAMLPQRRARVAELARGRVAPIVDYVRGEAAGAPPPLASSAARWAGIIRALDGFDAGPSPANPVGRLEQFIAVDLDRLQTRGCADIARAVGGRSGDWFTNQQLAIGARVFGRCRAGLLAQIQARYAAIRTGFAELIGGRFPFGAANAQGADPVAVRAFFAAHGAALQPLKDQMDDVGIERAAAAALGQLIAAEAALAPMLTAGEPKPLSYTVQASFFTDADRARAQDQVIEASIGTLASRATTPGETGGFTWSNGEAVVIRLRWAANAPSLPKTGIAAAGGACEPAPAGAWYATRLDRDWALLRLLAAGAGDDAGYGAGGYPVAIDVPLCANRASARLGDEPGDRARVFMRLLLAAPPPAPDKPATPILLPRFPASLPELAELGGQRTRIGSR